MAGDMICGADLAEIRTKKHEELYPEKVERTDPSRSKQPCFDCPMLFIQMAPSSLLFPSSLTLPPPWSISSSPPQKVPSLSSHTHSPLTFRTGNQGLRYFPHSGYLGLTPVKVEGSKSISFFTRISSNHHFQQSSEQNLTMT